MNTPLALPVQRGLRHDVRGLTTEVITTLAGIGAALAVVALNVAFEHATDFDLLGLTYAFVLPIGALLGGFGAAAGYYFAARITSTLPSRRMLFEMLMIGFSTWLMMHWVDYATLRFRDGAFVRDAVPFRDYLRLRTVHLQLTIENAGSTTPSTTPELGLLGYVHELLQIVGFLFGGFVMWSGLKTHEACEPCSRYAPSFKLVQRATSAAFDEMLQRAGVALPSLAQRVATAARGKRLVGMDLSLATCPCCRRSWARPGAVILQGNQPVVRRMDCYDLTAAQAAALRLAAPVK
ncbi:MAG: hypothetical protein ACJ796_22565 [Gemmatimonadaceae bacterium]